MISGEGLDMNCFGEILTASWRKDSPLQLWDYETLQLKNDIEWNFKEKENVKASTKLYCVNSLIILENIYSLKAHKLMLLNYLIGIEEDLHVLIN